MIAGLALGEMQPLFELGQAGEIAVAGLLGLLASLFQTLRLGRGGAGGLTELGKLLGDGREPRVGLVQRVERGDDVDPKRLSSLAGLGERGVQPVVADARLVGLLLCLVDGGLHLDGARR